MRQISDSFCDSVKSGSNFLIFTHVRPDGDALGSSFGLRDALRASGKGADVVIPCEMPDRYRKFFVGAKTSVTPEEAKSYDRILILDCATFERVERGNFEISESDITVLNLDHHRGNTTCNIADVSYVDPEASSTCQLAFMLADQCGLNISKTAATSILIGMMTDTGNFRFSNTTGDTLRCAASLIDAGAELESAVNTIYFSKSMRQRNFETDMVSNALKFVSNDRIAYAYISDEMLAKHNFSLKEDEGIIDILREIDSVIIAVLIHKKDGAFKLSMRSKDRRYPVRPVAQEFGGGGHDLASGATIEADDIDAALEQLLPKLEKLLNS